MQIALVCHQEVQRILKLEQGVKVVVAEENGQLARLQALWYSTKRFRYQVPDYNEAAYPHAQLHDHGVQHVRLHARFYHGQASRIYKGNMCSASHGRDER